MHFHDVTESERLRQLEQDEMDRAAAVQRALVPGVLPATPGWTFGTSTSPARQVGGDFYDVRVHQPSIVLSLGDVMGKGMDAGMLAAATRTALRSTRSRQRPHQMSSTVLRASSTVICAASAHSSRSPMSGSTWTPATSDSQTRATACTSSSGPVPAESKGFRPTICRWDWATIGANSPTAWPPGDMILLVSDGVLDLWGGSVEGLEDAIVAVRQWQ